MRWLIYFIPALFIELWCYITAPFVAWRIKLDRRTDRVKRLGDMQVTMPRAYLAFPFCLYQTHDNAVDEYWYGAFNLKSTFKTVREWNQADYDNSKWVRYVCRVLWLWRNCAYGFLYAWFSVPVEKALSTHEYGTEDAGFWLKYESFASSFKLELQIPLGKRYFSLNIGWKEHKGKPKKLYANRLISVRRY